MDADELHQREQLLRTIESKSELAGRFTDPKRLEPNGGSGCFSLVVTAQDKITSKRVALKFFNPQKSGDRYRVECFARESTILTELKGEPGVLECIQPLTEFQEAFRHPAYGIEIKVPFQFYAAELASTDVATIIENNKWSIREKLVNFREMVKILRRVHNRRIMHRDLKPGNFLVMADGRLRISDFGTARDPSSAILASYSRPPGDLAYTPLEMIGSLHDVDSTLGFLADYYALGAMLFELFTGTALNIQLFTRDMFDTLNQAMTAVNRTDRKRIYDSTISAICNKYSLPGVEEFSTNTPDPIRAGINRLYRSLASLDYRRRLTDPESIYRQVDRCIIILDNDEAYRRWKRRREQFRAAAQAKREHAALRKVELAK